MGHFVWSQLDSWVVCSLGCPLSVVFGVKITHEYRLVDGAIAFKVWNGWVNHTLLGVCFQCVSLPILRIALGHGDWKTIDGSVLQLVILSAVESPVGTAKLDAMLMHFLECFSARALHVSCVLTLKSISVQLANLLSVLLLLHNFAIWSVESRKLSEMIVQVLLPFLRWLRKSSLPVTFRRSFASYKDHGHYFISLLKDVAQFWSFEFMIVLLNCPLCFFDMECCSSVDSFDFLQVLVHLRGQVSLHHVLSEQRLHCAFTLFSPIIVLFRRYRGSVDFYAFA